MSDELLALARRAAGEARGDEQVEAYVVRTRETDIEVFGGDVESLAVAGVEGIGVRVVAGGRQGYAWAGSLAPDAVAEAVREARDNVRFAEPDEWAGLPTPAELGATAVAPLDLWRPELVDVPTGEKVRVALELEAATKAADPRIRAVESTGYGDGLVETAIASSRGVEAVHRRTVCSAHAVALAADGDETRTGYGFSAGRSLAELDLAAIPVDAATRACRLLGARPPRTRHLPVLLDPLVTRAVLAVLAGALSGEAVLKGRSMFAGRVGEQIAGPHVHLVEDPTDDRALGAAPHDAEGAPTRRIDLLDGGVLTGFLHNVWTGRRAGLATTGSAVRGGVASTPGVGARALRLEPGARPPEAIVAGLDDALYVQSVSGLHSGTNPVSGDFSVGAEGLVIRDGAFAEPVHECTIASTLPRMLGDLAEIASDLTFLPGSTAGVTVLLADVSLAGT